MTAASNFMDDMGDGPGEFDPMVSKRARSIEQSSIRQMFDLAEAQGGDLVRLELGEPDFDTPGHVVEAACRAAQAGDTHYTANAGLPALRQSIASKLRREEDLSVDPASEVIVTNGGMEALHLALLTILDPGDEVVIPTPAWPNYFTQTRLAEGRPVEVPLSASEGFDLDADAVVEAITPATGAVVLCSPSNPTGQVYAEDAVRSVVRAAADHDAFVVADEVYRSLVYDRRPPAIASTGDPTNVLTVGSCSKQYAMTGWRVGWLVGPDTVVERANAIHESTTACAGSISQRAAIAALDGPQEPAEAMCRAFNDRRDVVFERLRGIQGISCPRPDGAFYAFVDVSALEGSSFDVARRLLSEYGVVVAPGEGFGGAGKGHLRLSFATGMDRLELGLDRFERMVRAELNA